MFYESNYGPISVDLFAPGDSVVSTFPLGLCNSTCENNNKHVSYGYHHDSGTSFAAPYVSGVAALVWAKYPTLSATNVKKLILGSVNDLSADNRYSLCTTGGYLNAYGAIVGQDHVHDYRLIDNDITRHKLFCPCGAQTFTNHTFTYESISSTSHSCSCACGRIVDESHENTYSNATFTTHLQVCILCGATSTVVHTYNYSNITSSTHKQTCTACGYNTVVPHLWRVINKSVTGHVKQCNCGHTVDEVHTWVQNALGGYICSVCRQTGNFIPGIQSLLTPAGRLALQVANLQHGQVALIEGLPIIYFNGEYYLLSDSTTQVPYPIPPALQTE